MAALTRPLAIVSASGSISTAALLLGVYSYARLQSGGGYLASEQDPAIVASRHERRTLRSTIASSRLARREVTLRMRDGSGLRCRLVDCGGPLSVYVDGDYEVAGFEWSKAKCIVDIGAHVGSFTIWASRRVPQARLVAVEPNPDTYALLVSNLEANGLLGRSVAIRAAVGSVEGVSGLELTDHSLGTRLSRGASASGQTVEVRTLRGLFDLAGVDDVDFLKMDCEGEEYDVFGSVDPDLLNRVKAIACEYHPDASRDGSTLDRILRNAGFAVANPTNSLGVIQATR